MILLLLSVICCYHLAYLVLLAEVSLFNTYIALALEFFTRKSSLNWPLRVTEPFVRWLGGACPCRCTGEKSPACLFLPIRQEEVVQRENCDWINSSGLLERFKWMKGLHQTTLVTIESKGFPLERWARPDNHPCNLAVACITTTLVFYCCIINY